MAASTAVPAEYLDQIAGVEDTNGMNGQDDPFTVETPQHPHPHRFSSFDSQLFALNHPSSSPAQAKRALEAHLAETDRRIQETSKLGTSLVQQRVNLSQRLRDVSTQEEDAQIGPELRQKLVEIEKEYNEVGRQSARAFLGPRSETPGLGEGTNPAFALDGKNPTSPSKFSSQATDSPSKLNVPRKQRNQASNSDHIEFAAEITTSLLGQVRHLQAALIERDEALKIANAENSRLELEAEGFSQRLRSLDDSEQRYKDENWTLETQLQETNSAAREAASREHKLQQALASSISEKNAAQRELDDLRQNHSKVTEDYAAVRKTHESELVSLRKSVNLGDNEKTALQRKIEDLTSQNQELAKGLAGRFRVEEAEPEANVGAQSDDFPFDLSEREHSPPPSPTKGGQRHSMLESETLKSSLNHAHRMIQSLKGNVHREKTEKQDLKRMLQEARDELEIRKAEPNEKRLKSKSHQDMRKVGRPMLGAARNSRRDIMVDQPEHDPDWEDHDELNIPGHPIGGDRLLVQEHAPAPSRSADMSDAYQTANETEDAFETANERDTTDNDAFETGAESIAKDSSDEMTETETGANRTGTIRGTKPPPLALAKSGERRRSVQSTASTSDDEDDHAIHTPVQGQPQRFRLKLNRNARRSRGGTQVLDTSNPSTAKNSPAGFMNGGDEVCQSLASELENISGDEADGTPSRGRISSPKPAHSLRRSISGKRSSSTIGRGVSSGSSTPGQRPTTVLYNETAPPVPRIPTVDSGMMTEPWEPAQEDVDQFSRSPAQSGIIPQSSASAITSRIFGNPPSTPQNKGFGAFGSNPGSTSTSTSTPPRPVWDQPLQMFAGVIPGFNQSTNTTPLSTRSAGSQSRDVPAVSTSDEQRLQSFSDDLAQGKTSEPRPEKQVSPPPLSMSPIQSLETNPVAAVQAHVPKEAYNMSMSAEASAAPSEPIQEVADTGRGSILGSVFGWNKPKETPAPQIAEDEISRNFSSTTVPTTKTTTPLKEMSVNGPVRNYPDKEFSQSELSQDLAAASISTDDERKMSLQDRPVRNFQDRAISQEPHSVTPVYKADQSSQTVLSSEQIDSLLSKKDKPPILETPAAAAMKPLSQIGAVSPPLPSQRFQESDPIKDKVPEMTGKDSLGKSFKRPTSATSLRSRTTQYPPLPPDHQEAIAAAAQRAPSTEPISMGPPAAPASAYPSSSARSKRSSRPQTPSGQGLPSPSSKGGTTPRAGRYSTARSQVSRRTSVSSFASELDERFNIRTEGMPMPNGFQANTDPRMIQAITQTMIGEMMWKYTRKAGRGEMSNTRHRRFFWVHPYTRTLYWSDHDPATANRAELKSKSVAIEAVRVVTDDNPMPPGLHRKSLIIVTPGRSVKFTAQTSQRHETWFNALSYLLLRTNPDGTTANNAGDLTDADVDEFNPQTVYNRRSARSRVSLASFKSHANLNRQVHSSLSSRAPATMSNNSTTQFHQQPQPDEEDKPTGSIRRRISRSLSRSRGGKQRESSIASNGNNGNQHASISSRISSYWKPADPRRASTRSRSSISSETPLEVGVLKGGRSVVGGSRGHDSAEDLRRVIEERERGGDLENVRACCNGRHDVGGLAHGSRAHSHAGSTTSVRSHRSASLTNLAYS